MLMVLFSMVIVGFAHSENEINYKTVNHAVPKVLLRPPTNLSTFLISSTDIYIVWVPPRVYINIHDVNLNDTSWLDDNTTQVWMKIDQRPSTVTVETTSPFSGESSSSTKDTNLNSSNVDSTTQVPDGINTSSVPVTHKPIENSSEPANKSKSHCKSFAFLKNGTYSGDYLNAPVNKDLHHINSQEIRPENPDAEISTLGNIGINEVMVNFDKGCVEEYIISVYNDTGDILKVMKLDGDQPTEINITELQPDTKYRIIIGARFTSSHILNSTSLSVTTKADPKTRVCVCDRSGTIGGKQVCNITSSTNTWCNCKSGYTGIFCEVCKPGFYKSAMFFPCHSCPCAHHSSSVTSCHFVEGFLVCDKCRTGYTGNLCHQCANGFYRYKNKYCVACRCNGNTDSTAPMMCDPYSGACVSCMKNTTGFNCERCRKGYIGDALVYKNCTHKSDVMKEDILPLPAGYIAAICVGTILLLCIIVGFLVYKRWNMYPTMKPFWTVELKEDHEGVNFSAVEDQEFLKHAQTNEDGEFYEKRGGRGMKYAQLREDV
ncbi:hypothetical protein SNE40_000797 [Patella caerulea]|uniref:Laminin EGF-like domain-containing protein n=1 Tax=Patella caerulea TaxID=87958 RepID=A0AAN8K5V1_PATCE